MFLMKKVERMLKRTLIIFIFIISNFSKAFSESECKSIEADYNRDVAYCEALDDKWVDNCNPPNEDSANYKFVKVELADFGGERIGIGCRASKCNGSDAGFYWWSPRIYPLSCIPQDHEKQQYFTPDIRRYNTENADPCTFVGSIIYNSNQVIGEIIPLTGLDFSLSHFSSRVEGRVGDYTTDFKINTKNLLSKINSVEFLAYDDNNQLVKSQTYSKNIETTFYLNWNGLDSSNQKTWGSRKYKFIYRTNSSDNSIADLEYSLALGNFKAIKLGLGGWVPTIWNFYDHTSEKLYLGSGNVKGVKAVKEGSLYRVAGNGGNEVYYFDELGRQVLTKTSLTGSVVYRFNYDDITQKLINITDAFNRVTRFKYDENNNLSEIVSPENVKTRIVLNSDGYIQSVTNPKNEVYRMEYVDAKGLLKKFTKPTGTFAEFTYDDKGNLVRDLNSSGLESKLEKTSVGVKTTTAMGRVFENNYDSKKNQEVSISPSGLKTTYTNSATESKVENVISITKSDLVNDPRFGDQVKNFSATTINNFGTKTIVENNVAELSDPSNIFSINNLTKTVAEGPSVVSSSYDGLTRTHTVVTSEGRQLATQVDSLERPILSQVGSTLPTKYNYQNELLTTISQGDRKTEFFYNPNNKLLMSVKNAEGQKVNFLYDDAQRLKAKQLPDGRVIQYHYDSNNNLVSITPPSRPAHLMNFGANELLSSYNPPALLGVANVNTQYSYNKDKDLVKITRPDGEVINYNRNQTTGLLDSITGSFGTISRQYQNEQLTKITDQNGQVANFSYTGNVVTGLSILDSNQREVYSFGRSSSSQFPGLVGSESIRVGNNNQSVDYEYDNDKVLKRAGDLHLEYNTPNGQLVKTTLDNVKEYFTYNKVGEIKSYTAKILKNNKEETIYAYRLERDKLGRIIKKIERYSDEKDKKHHHHERHEHEHEKDSIVTEYSYDKAGRLVHVEKEHGQDSRYVFDQNSNRIMGIASGERFDAVYDNQDRLIRYNNSTFSYNANGDMISKADQKGCDMKSKKPTYETTSIQYDVFGNLKQYGKVSYKIDPLNKRLSRSVNGIVTNMYAYNPEGQMIAELDGSGSLKKYFVYGSNYNVPDYFIDLNNIRYKIITDLLGSIRLVVNSNTGAVVEKMTHDEFGRVLTDSNPNFIPFGFAGGVYDKDTNLVNFSARDYDARIGRWISKDPILFNGGDSNLYGYVLQDPVNFVDPSGYESYSANEERTSSFNKNGSIGGGGGSGTRFNSNQSALVSIAKEGRRNGFTPEEASTLKNWANEYGINFRMDGPHPGTNTNYPHLHIGPINHIPIKCDK